MVELIGGGLQMLRVVKDLSGGVAIELGGQGCVLSPADAMKFGAAVLKAAGCNVNFDGDPRTKKQLFGRRIGS